MIAGTDPGSTAARGTIAMVIVIATIAGPTATATVATSRAKADTGAAIDIRVPTAAIAIRRGTFSPRPHAAAATFLERL
jgi:hypothetical protein